MCLRKICVLIVVILTLTKSEYVSYKNYKVYKTIPKTENEEQIIFDVHKKNGFKYWSGANKVGRELRMLMAPEKQKKNEAYFAEVGIDFKIVINDVQEVIDAQFHRPITAKRNVSEYSWNYYQTLDEIYEWLDIIAERHSDVVTPVNIGISVEGRPIKGVIIDFRNRANSTIGMIEGGIHAREWIAPATVTWIINEFLTSRDPGVRSLAENIVWHIFPVTNPDGYVYTFTNNRFWRKNRSRANFTSCAEWEIDDDLSNGVDLNRNFGFLWMSTGASSNPCSEIYAGPVPFSEPEAVAIASYVNRIQTNRDLLFYYAFHSFSQMVLVPFSHAGGANVLEAPNYANMYEIAIKGMDKLQARHGTKYTVGTSADILYEVSGSSFDWVKGVAHVPLVYLFELRDLGDFGFLLPSEFIIPNNEEVMDGLVEMDRMARAIGYHQHHSSSCNLKLNIAIFLLALFVAI